MANVDDENTQGPVRGGGTGTIERSERNDRGGLKPTLAPFIHISQSVRLVLTE
jgi:hypothetical protein